jgi:hypothetical protein
VLRDEPARVYRVGEGFYEVPGSHHRISENASDRDPAILFAPLSQIAQRPGFFQVCELSVGAKINRAPDEHDLWPSVGRAIGRVQWRGDKGSNKRWTIIHGSIIPPHDLYMLPYVGLTRSRVWLEAHARYGV